MRRLLPIVVALLVGAAVEARAQYPVDRSARLYAQAGYEIPGAPQVFERLWNLGATSSLAVGLPVSDRLVLRPGLTFSRFGLNEDLALDYLYREVTALEGGTYRALSVDLDVLVYLAPASTTLNLYGVAGGGYYAGGLSDLQPGGLDVIARWADRASTTLQGRAGLGLQIRVTERLTTFFEWHLAGAFSRETVILQAAGTTGVAWSFGLGSDEHADASSRSDR